MKTKTEPGPHSERVQERQRYTTTNTTTIICTERERATPPVTFSRVGLEGDLNSSLHPPPPPPPP